MEQSPKTPEKKKKKISPKLKAGCGVIFVFALGFVFGMIALLVLIGGVVKQAETWKTPESKEFIANHFINQLKLDEEQQAKFRPIVDEILEERWELRRDYLQENQRLMKEKYVPRVAEILNEKQKEKAKKMLEKWQRDQAYKINAD